MNGKKPQISAASNEFQMTKLVLEMWVRDIVSRVETGQPDEDHRVELKSQWKDAKEIVRQLAGHANTARGDQILWIIGVDAKNRVVTGADQKELSTWLPQLQSEFNEAIYPELVQHLNVPIEEKSVVALLFETDRYPYVIKTNGGKSELEVPWRDGTRTRSAKRSDLLRLLSPLHKLPGLEVLGGTLITKKRHKSDDERGVYEYGIEFVLDIFLYVSPRTTERICIPRHRCETWIEILNFLPKTRCCNCQFYVQTQKPSSLTILRSSDDILIDGPGELQGVVRDVLTPSMNFPNETIIEFTITIWPVDAGQRITVKILFECEKKNDELRWFMKSSDLTQHPITE